MSPGPCEAYKARKKKKKGLHVILITNATTNLKYANKDRRLAREEVRQTRH